MGKLTTHVLDVSIGLPAAGVRIDLHDRSPSRGQQLLHSMVTGMDGRCEAPLLADGQFHSGLFALIFHVGDYFRARGVVLPEPALFDQVVIQLGIARPHEHYHVPLLITPWSYSVYRGG